MPATVPVPTKNPGDVLTSSLWNTYVAGNINKLLNQGHRVLTVAQFGALTGLEDRDEVYLEVDGTNGIEWHLAYHLASTSWRFLGGPPMFAEVTTAEATSSGTYAALATAGPSLTTPRAGDYTVEIGSRILIGTGGNGYMSYDIGGTGAADADAVVNSLVNSNPTTMRQRRKTGLATTIALTAKYRNDASTSSTFANRWISIVPVKVT